MNNWYRSFITEFSKLYPNYEFYFTAINDFADGLPEVATILDSKISKENLFEIELKYDDMLERILDNENIDTREYGGIIFVIESEFDKEFIRKKCKYFKVKNGLIYE